MKDKDEKTLEWFCYGGTKDWGFFFFQTSNIPGERKKRRGRVFLWRNPVVCTGQLVGWLLRVCVPLYLGRVLMRI